MNYGNVNNNLKQIKTMEGKMESVKRLLEKQKDALFLDISYCSEDCIAGRRRKEILLTEVNEIDEALFILFSDNNRRELLLSYEREISLDTLTEREIVKQVDNYLNNIQ